MTHNHGDEQSVGSNLTRKDAIHLPGANLQKPSRWTNPHPAPAEVGPPTSGEDEIPPAQRT